ncbi:MAG TPA: Photosystem I reaction center subunit III [Leptolyngbyaceae cyanobacterium M33_DOE_097]|uniref:Photosystem I reaction center subunit III n=1 Tax=Oscillatoriales cyanobacterium SpSt-418 TaxID=2282169 RepID=A0A7C3KD05_9CYAN|nr:Photosystem I reaction center subunit III [Leptolyngbyaceae cyanobacterium M33_DOE_097]
MRRLFALFLAIALWFGVMPATPAEASVLTPCKDNPAFIQRAKNAVGDQAKARFELYSQVNCGEEGLPHLIPDIGRGNENQFVIPAILFLYIAGWIGWVGRAYLIAARASGNAEEKEIIIDIPLAIRCVAQGPLWPLLAVKELASGELTARDNEITISPR